ncbi:hypothetical protein V2J09_006837, partial [Rumex salicifolius]
SDLAYETSNSASHAHSKSSVSDASISNVPSLNVNQLFNDITDQMSHIMESQATTLPPQWPLHKFSRVVIGEKRLSTHGRRQQQPEEQDGGSGKRSTDGEVGRERRTEARSKQENGELGEDMGELSLKDVKLEPNSNVDYGLLANQSKATRLEENPSSNAPSSSQSGTSMLDEARSTVDSASPSASPLGPAPICRQFWKSGEYLEENAVSKSSTQNNRSYLHVHPKFLHTNATSHKWAFGAFAELLDNAIDEIQNGATFVNVDKISNPRDGSPALLFQDDGSGMDPTVIRQCMSFGFSDKNSKSTIGQYGNGFKTSTMRLGADAIVFSRHVKNGRTTQSVGLLSYTYLSWARLDRIVVPMVDFELNRSTRKFEPLQQYSKAHVQINLSILLKWSPFSTLKELVKQFDDLSAHGTKIIVYNLWESDNGVFEFDFEKDPEVYLSILYLRIPQHFNIILRGNVVQHRNIADDLKYIEYILYKPQTGGTAEAQVVTTIGFLKEAPEVNIHGFNVYHKNRLILPFSHVVSFSDSRGRGVVGILEANFIKPSHNKQDFEKTSLFQKLEHRLKEMTWEYWDYHCGLIGYQVKKKLPPIKSSNDTPNIAKCVPSLSNSSILAAPHNAQLQVPGMKRTHQTFSAEPGHGKKIARTGPDGVNVGRFEPIHIQAPTNAVNMENIPQALIDENRSLQRRCFEHKRTLEELGQTVLQLKSNLEGARDEHARMLLELKQIEIIKREKKSGGRNLPKLFPPL